MSAVFGCVWFAWLNGELAAVAEEYEASVVSGSPFPTSPPVPRSRLIQSTGHSVKAAPKKSWNASSSPAPRAGPSSTPASRPGPKPLTHGHGEEIDSRRGKSGGGGSDSFLLTQAEKRKIQARDDKRESEQCFDFLVDIRDRDGHRPGEPEYDGRTIYIPKSSREQFTAFEEQFWNIKQNCYDTVLFFQKGKFYELYEDDALIGHREFDLKLTERVKMKMVRSYCHSRNRP